MELFTTMPIQHSDTFCIQIALTLTLLLTGVVNHSEALKCYTCGETNLFLGLNYTKNQPPRSCRDFESSDQEALKAFIIECPSDYLGCITQIQGELIIRTCDTFAIDDCQTANGITYCYCNYDLCNGKDNHLTKIDDLQDITEHDEDAQEMITDDEDYVDMSGFGHKFTDRNQHREMEEEINEDFPKNIENNDNSTEITITTTSSTVQFQNNSLPSYVTNSLLDSTGTIITTKKESEEQKPTVRPIPITNTPLVRNITFQKTATSRGIQFLSNFKCLIVMLILFPI